MSAIHVRHLSGDRFEISVRDHTVYADQMLAGGGEDTGPTPTELFVAGLASCVAHYARRYLARHELPTEGLAVETEFAFGSRPNRVSEIRMEIRLPDGVPAERRDALLAVASHCTVHNSLQQTPEVSIALVDTAAVAS